MSAHAPPEADPPPPPDGPTRLGELSGRQWRSGLAAWLGWLFDGLDMHLYTLVAAPFVASLLAVADTADPQVKEKSAWVQAAFLVGWALGGAVFGRIGDLLGRSRALALTILTYATFTGLSFFATQWWHLLIFRFLAALGIGGEWAVGASLLAETWPKRWRAWIAAVLQTGVNLGVLLACLTVYLLAGFPERYVFLVGVLPALLVFWVRTAVGEPEEWHAARAEASGRGETPRISDLFRGEVRSVTLRTIGVCACALTGWWAFMFWHVQQLRALPEVAGWAEPDKARLTSTAFFLVIGTSIVGNFFAGWLARRVGYRRAVALLCLAFFGAMTVTYGAERDYKTVLALVPLVGFCSGVFGLFTMYLPPLFPTLLRTTGAGFSYNVGRVAAAAGTVVFGLYAPVPDLRLTLLAVGFLFLPAAAVALTMPDLWDEP